MRMRQPWHERKLSVCHLRTYRNLIELYALLDEWTKITQQKISLEILQKLTPDLQTDLSLDIPSKNLLHLLDDTYPEDVFSKLEHDILESHNLFASEAWPHQDSLSEISFARGKKCAEKRWPKPHSFRFSTLPDVFAGFYDSPWNDFFVIQSLPHELTFQTLSGSSQTLLCELYLSWTKGFIHSLNSQVLITYDPKGRIQKWQLIH